MQPSTNTVLEIVRSSRNINTININIIINNNNNSNSASTLHNGLGPSTGSLTRA